MFLSPECLIKSLINPRNVTKMESTFGTWMKDTARLNDERVWVAEHFAGRPQRTDSMDAAEGYIHPISRSERLTKIRIKSVEHNDDVIH